MHNPGCQCPNCFRQRQEIIEECFIRGSKAAEKSSAVEITSLKSNIAVLEKEVEKLRIIVDQACCFLVLEEGGMAGYIRGIDPDRCSVQFYPELAEYLKESNRC